MNGLISKMHFEPHETYTQIAVCCWANIGYGCQHCKWFANVSPINQSLEMVGKWLATKCCIINLMPTLGQCWKSNHKLTFSQNCWGMVGKGLTSQHHTVNLMPTLGQHWNSDNLLLFLKNHGQMVGYWSDRRQLKDQDAV